MFRSIIFLSIALIALVAPAYAERPDIQPGLWEYTNRMSFDTRAPIPDREHSNQECVSDEDLGRGDTFLEDMDECEIISQDMRRDGMDYEMTCAGPDGTRMTMDASMQFAGDTVSGLFTGNMETPMGPMQMNIEMDGRRIDDC